MWKKRKEGVEKERDYGEKSFERNGLPPITRKRERTVRLFNGGRTEKYIVSAAF